MRRMDHDLRVANYTFRVNLFFSSTLLFDDLAGGKHQTNVHSVFKRNSYQQLWTFTFHKDRKNHESERGVTVFSF